MFLIITQSASFAVGLGNKTGFKNLFQVWTVQTSLCDTAYKNNHHLRVSRINRFNSCNYELRAILTGNGRWACDVGNWGVCGATPSVGDGDRRRVCPGNGGLRRAPMPPVPPRLFKMRPVGLAVLLPPTPTCPSWVSERMCRTVVVASGPPSDVTRFCRGRMSARSELTSIVAPASEKRENEKYYHK